MKMIKFIFATGGIAILLAGSKTAGAQTQSDSTTRANQGTWDITTLTAPSSPGASLIGISPSVIQKPTDPAAFSASLLNATSNLTAIPNSYAVDFSPAWLFFGQHISYKDFTSNNVGKNIWQSLDISFAYNNAKDSTTNQTNTTVGIGIKISLLRGKVNSKADQQVQKARKIIGLMATSDADLTTAYENNHKSFRNLIFRADTTQSPAAKQLLVAQVNKTLDSLRKALPSQADSLKKIGENLSFTRFGPKLDLAGGLSYLFPNQSYTNGALNNAGIWLTGGYEDESSKFSILGIARYLYNPKQAYDDPNDVLKQTDLNTFDAGIRLLIGTSDSKFTFGGEFVYRSILNDTALPSSWHYSLSADYQVGKNQRLSFNFGRDFDGTVTKGGTLLAALNFIIGFGGNKSILDSKK